MLDKNSDRKWCLLSEWWFSLGKRVRVGMDEGTRELEMLNKNLNSWSGCCLRGCVYFVIIYETGHLWFVYSFLCMLYSIKMFTKMG